MRMHNSLILAWISAAALLQRVAGQSQFAIRPNDVTVPLGVSNEFRCAPSNQGDTITWSVYMGQSGGAVTQQKLLTVTSNGSPNYLYSGPPKYYNNNTWDLVVNNIQLSDGETYGCDSTTVPTDAYANMVVIGQIGLTAYPSGPQTLGTYVTFTCSVQYGAPNNTIYPLAPGHVPQLTMLIGQTNMYATVTSYSLALTATFSTTLNQQMVGQNVTCLVTSVAAGVTYQATAGIPYPLPYPPNTAWVNATISPYAITTLPQYTVINCTANGYPAASVSWVPLDPDMSNPLIYNYGQSIAFLQLSTIGTNIQWNCTATNSVTPPFQQLNVTYTFTVTNIYGVVPAGSFQGAASHLQYPGIACGLLLAALAVIMKDSSAS
jgi:hypothetical protein